MTEVCKSCGRAFQVRRGRYQRRTLEGFIDTSKGVLIAIDQEDKDLGRYNWLVDRQNYAVTNALGRPRALMHRLIMARSVGRDLLASEIVDHIDRDPTNNRRGNLRIVTARQNVQNSGPRSGNKSGYKGVTVERSGRIAAWICSEGRNFRIGTFTSLEEGAWFYDQWALSLFGEHAYTNFDYL